MTTYQTRRPLLYLSDSTSTRRPTMDIALTALASLSVLAIAAGRALPRASRTQSRLGELCRPIDSDERQ